MSPESLEYILTNSSMMPRLEKIRTASVDYFVKVLKKMLREVTRIFAKPSRIHCYVTIILSNHPHSSCHPMSLCYSTHSVQSSGFTEHPQHAWPGCRYVKRESQSRSVVSDSLRPHGLNSPWNSPSQDAGVGSCSWGSSQPRDQTQVSHFAGVFLPAEPQGKPKNTGMGSLSLLQWISPTQESNQGLLHCRRILYQLDYQGIPSMQRYS